MNMQIQYYLGVVRMLDVRSSHLSEKQICDIKSCHQIKNAIFLHGHNNLKCFTITVEQASTTVPITERNVYLSTDTFGKWAAVSTGAWVVSLVCSIITAVGICKKFRQISAQVGLSK